MNQSADDLRTRNLLTIAGLAAVFLLPLLGAAWLYYGTAWRPAGHVNHGELISPPRPLPGVSLPPVPGTDGRELSAAMPALFRGTWTIAYVGDGGCDRACRRALYVLRQTRLALGTDVTRVAGVFLVTGNCCAKALLARERAGVALLDATGAPAARLLGEFPRGDRAYSLFIVDPLGNLMMRYDVRRNPGGLLIDLRRLLALSDIG